MEPVGESIPLTAFSSSYGSIEYIQEPKSSSPSKLYLLAKKYLTGCCGIDESPPQEVDQEIDFMADFLAQTALQMEEVPLNSIGGVLPEDLDRIREVRRNFIQIASGYSRGIKIKHEAKVIKLDFNYLYMAYSLFSWDKKVEPSYRNKLFYYMLLGEAKVRKDRDFSNYAIKIFAHKNFKLKYKLKGDDVKEMTQPFFASNLTEEKLIELGVQALKAPFNLLKEQDFFSTLPQTTSIRVEKGDRVIKYQFEAAYLENDEKLVEFSCGLKIERWAATRYCRIIVSLFENLSFYPALSADALVKINAIVVGDNRGVS